MAIRFSFFLKKFNLIFYTFRLLDGVNGEDINIEDNALSYHIISTLTTLIVFCLTAAQR